MKNTRRGGFTLVEIMIVVGIIILLAAFAIPNFVRMRVNANEGAAIASMRSISTAMQNFRTGSSPPVFPAQINLLSSAIPPYIDSELGSGIKQGYAFVFSAVSGGDTYTCTATPQSAFSGTRTFVVTEGGVITSGGIPIE